MQLLGGFVLDLGDRDADVVGPIAGLPAEQRPPDDGQRQPDHLGGDVQGLACPGGGLPALHHLLRQFGYRGGEAGDGVVVKRRLHELALRAPELALAREQPVADEGAEALVAGPLRVVAVIVLEHVLDMPGVVEQAERLGADTHEHDVPEPLGEPAVVAQRIPRRPADDARENGHAAWPRGRGQSLDRHHSASAGPGCRRGAGPSAALAGSVAAESAAALRPGRRRP